jgi:hypothetical protein
MEGRKKAVSLRINTADLRKVKKLAHRLGVRDSDIIRFALKTTLARVALLCDDTVRGRALLPLFVDAGSDLFHHFDLDTTRLIEIVNDGVPKDQEVEAGDLQLLAMAGIQQTYATVGLSRATPIEDGPRPASHAAETLTGRLRGYLFSKYVAVEPARDGTAG